MPAALVADIPSQPLPRALEDFSRQTAVQVAYLSEVVGARRTQGAPSGLAPEDALERLLRGTGLHYEFLNPRIIRIRTTEPPPPPARAPQLDEVVINGLAIRNPIRIAPANTQEQHILDAANEELQRRIERCGLLYGNSALDQYLQGIAERLLAANASDAAAVHVRVIKGTSANAFSLSDGSIYVTTALLASLDDESELAAILGHELTHYTNAHVLRAYRTEHTQEVSEHVGLLLLSALSGLGFPLDMPKYPLGTHAILKRASVSGYSPDLEREADTGGIQRMISAGYDASGAVAALQQLQGPADSSAELPIYASHRKLAQRLASYRELLAGKHAKLAAAGGETRRADYQGQLGTLPLDQVSILVDYGDLDRAERILNAVIATGDSGRAEFLKGETARKHLPRSDAGVERALAAYALAVTYPDAPAATYREVGLLRRLRGESADAALAFQSYLERAPLAADAPLIRRYLEDARPAAPPP